MRVWRLCPARRAESAFDGEGARLHGGRWNHVGVPAVYAAATISLAVLEILVHADHDLLPEALAVIAVDVPPRLVTDLGGVAALPDGWRRTPAPDELKEIGTAFLRTGRTPVLAVPSAVVPQERNYLLNPRLPRFADLVVGTAQPFSLDPRLR